MAEMLVNSTKLDACLDAEADAIRAKTGDSNDITFDFANNKGFADAIAAIPSGGGSLPSNITELAGGSFTLSDTTSCNAQKIQHGMSASPKAFFIWSDDAFVETSTDTKTYLINGYFCTINTKNQSGAVAGYFVSQYYRQSDLRLSANLGARTSVQNASFVNADYICQNDRGDYYQAGKTYKWLAWA